MNLKRPYIRSDKIRKSANGEECTLNIEGVCDYNTETTVLAHINSERKGRGIKSDDIFAVYACGACHAALDGGELIGTDYYFYVLRGIQRTHLRMVETGLLRVA